MTHIEQMIQDMCPNGIEFKTLGEVCTIETGKLNANAAEENGQYPFFTTSKEISYINEYKWDTEALLIAGNANIGDVKHYIGKFNAYQRTYVLTNFQNGLIGRFLYHYTKARLKDFLDDKKNEAAMSYIVLSSLQAFPIPLPPIEIQKRIVECLDKFSALAAELQAELQLRRKQYEYYRTQLLTPHSDCNSADNTDDRNWEWKTLGEIGKVCMCKRILKNQTNNSSGIPFYKIGSFGGNADAYIDEETYLEYKHKYSYPNKGDILISAAGTIGKSVIFDGAPSYFQDSNIVWIANNESTVLNKYLYYYYQIVDWKVDDGGVIKRLYNDNLKATKIAFPPLAEQARIVSILDKFEALTTSLSDGIPAEQIRQQKRYEYYRDLLLTFPRKAE